MAVNTTVLLNGLEEYHKRLLLHVTALEQEYQQLERRWESFNAVYEGNAAEQFRGGWRRTADGFHDYIEQTQHIRRVLEERIAALREANRAEGKVS